ncbi:MAG: TonB-dependent siderophore receptor [Nostoc sp.]|uniref:TonB-dependent siderophore receptor n=1 Tax=Nostoc sp. TaxID=1180 RepID=UPI002FF699A8
MALRKDIALAQNPFPASRLGTDSGRLRLQGLDERQQPLGIHSQPRGWERGDTSLWAFLSAIRSGSQALSIRGFSGGVNRLRDGLRELVSRATDSDLTNLERVEVLKGPASVLYGLGGIGGTINLVTKQPLRDPFYKVDFLVGSYDLYRPSIDFSGPLNDSRTVLYRLNASYQDAGFYNDFGKNDRWFIAPVISWQISPDTKLTVEAQVSQQDLRGLMGLPAVGTVLPNPNGQIPRNRYLGEPNDFALYYDTKIGYDFQHRFSDNWSLRNAFRYTNYKLVDEVNVPNILAPDNRTLTRYFIIPGTNGEGANALADGFISTTDIVGNFHTGSIQHKLLFGVEYSHQGEEVDVSQGNVTPAIDIFNPVYGLATRGAITTRIKTSLSQNIFGVYLQDQIALTDNLKVLLGGRVDVVNQQSINRISNVTTTISDAVFSPRVGIVYQPIQPISLYASYSQSFNPVSGTDANGNSFIPERGTQYEVGMKAELSRKIAATLAFFDLTRTNVLTTDPNNSAFSIQTGKQSSRGIELDISGEILPGLKIAAGYAFIDARIDEDKVFPVGNQLNNAPQNTVGLWTSYEIQSSTFKGLGFGLGLFYVGERQGDLANSYSFPSYVRTDASIFYKRDRFRAALGVKNLFDVVYFDSSYGRNRVFYGEPLTLQGTISWEL